MQRRTKAQRDESLRKLAIEKDAALDQTFLEEREMKKLREELKCEIDAQGRENMRLENLCLLMMDLLLRLKVKLGKEIPRKMRKQIEVAQAHLIERDSL